MKKKQKKINTNIKNKKKLNSTNIKKDAVIKEIGGPSGPEPTRYGDWEVKGKVSDF